MMPDTVEIEDIATTKTAATIDPDGDYMVGQTAAGDTFRAFVEEVVRGVLAGIISQLEIGDDLSVDGLVGIGTASPESVLHLYKSSADWVNLKIERSAANLSAAVAYLAQSAASGTPDWYVGKDHRDTSDTDFRIWRYTGSHQTSDFTIDETGKVGIGTTSPAAKLQVNGSLAIVDGMTAPSTISGYATIYVDSADGDLKVKFADGTVKTIATDT